MQELTHGVVMVTPEFFAGIVRDYANHMTAIAREFYQNGFDNGAKNIAVSIRTLEAKDEVGNKLVEVTVQNDGDKMSYEELRDKLLSLGGTNKDGIKTTGGFGRAKELLYFCHNSYEIHSGPWLVKGVGANYTIERAEVLNGTRSTIVLSGVKTRAGLLIDEDCVIGCFTRVANKTTSPRNGHITVNGVEVRTFDYKKVLLNKSEYYKVYKCKVPGASGYAYVRHNGVWMFSHSLGFTVDYCLVVELTVPSVQVLTTNRDSFAGEASYVFSDLMRRYSIDKRSAARLPTVVKPKYSEGRSFYKVAASQEKDVVDTAVATEESTKTWEPEDVVATERAEVFTDTAYYQTPTGYRSTSHYSVYLECDYPKVPSARYWHYDSVMPAVPLLLTRWARLIDLLYAKSGQGGEFAVGLVFADDSAARYSGQDRSTFLINPLVLRGNKFRWRAKEMHRLPAIACHEFTHLFERYHDEDFASVFTEHAAMLTKHDKEISRILRSQDRYLFNFPVVWKSEVLSVAN